MRFRRLPNGYSDLGPVIIPPLPQPIVLTDRRTRTQYMVTYSTVDATPDDLGHLAINTNITFEKKVGIRVYDDPFDGPVFGDHGEYRLMIRNARIGIDYTPYAHGEQDRDGAPIFARNITNKGFEKMYTSVADPVTVRVGLTDEVD